MRRNWRLVLSLVLYLLVAGASVAAFGLLQQHQTPGLTVHWPVLFAQFTLFVLVIDLPLLVLALWFGRRLDSTIERVMRETLERVLPIAARLFIEHWNAARDRGDLPGQATTVITVATPDAPHVHTETETERPADGIPPATGATEPPGQYHRP